MTQRTATDLPVEIIEKTTPYRDYFQIDIYRLRHGKFAGGMTEELRREVLERGHAVVVLLYDPARDKVVLLEQFRIGAYAAGVAPWLIEVVAGIIEPGEAPEEVARREAVEEAGCALTDLVLIGKFLLSPGGTTETAVFYCGRVDSGGAGGIHGLEHEGEDIRVLVLDPAEALDMVMASEATNANAVIPLQWLALNRETLRARWLS